MRVWCVGRAEMGLMVVGKIVSSKKFWMRVYAHCHCATTGFFWSPGGAAGPSHPPTATPPPGGADPKWEVVNPQTSVWWGSQHTSRWSEGSRGFRILDLRAWLRGDGNIAKEYTLMI